jgi:hypothetical protein
MNAIDELPADYMKVLYRAVLNLFNETENDMGKQGRSYASYYLKEEVWTFFQSHAFF